VLQASDALALRGTYINVRNYYSKISSKHKKNAAPNGVSRSGEKAP
jgi:hypothetical protein